LFPLFIFLCASQNLSEKKYFSQRIGKPNHFDKIYAEYSTGLGKVERKEKKEN
jgi:hypothetical protein